MRQHIYSYWLLIIYMQFSWHSIWIFEYLKIAPPGNSPCGYDMHKSTNSASSVDIKTKFCGCLEIKISSWSRTIPISTSIQIWQQKRRQYTKVTLTWPPYCDTIVFLICMFFRVLLDLTTHTFCFHKKVDCFVQMLDFMPKYIQINGWSKPLYSYSLSGTG